VEGTVTNHVTPLPESAVFKMAYGQQKTVDLELVKKWQVSYFSPTFGTSDITYYNGVFYAANENTAIKKINAAGAVIETLDVSSLRGITADGAGNLYGTIISGTVIKVEIASFNSVSVFSSGLNYPWGIASADGFLYVAEGNIDGISQINSSGNRSVFVAGNGFSDEPPQFRMPHGVEVKDGFLYVADYNNNAIRKVNISTKKTVTLAGGSFGNNDGVGSAVQFRYPMAVKADDASNYLYVVHDNGDRVRKVEIATGKVTTLSLTGVPLGSTGGLCIVGDDLYVAARGGSGGGGIRKLTRNY
jgi:hypothetical protein